MRKFIDEIVELYLSDEAQNALSSCIITPNKRAHRFIKQAIINKSPKGGFLPGIFSIDDFIINHVPMVRIDEVDLTYILYEVFNQYNEQDDVDFDDFLSYASILLHDFNEIDMQMADGKSIFSYLNDAKAIQQWNPDGSPLSASQKEYLRFYNHLAHIYLEFRKVLFEKKLCYQGMAYRYFAENISDISTHLPWKEIIFAGFNALTKSEEYMIKALTKKEMVTTIWDVDSYYLNDHMMEAGMYLRKYQSWNKDIEKQAQKHFMSSKKNIEIIGAPGILGQVRVASQIMSSKIEKEEKNNSGRNKEKPTHFENNTVIVPADENLLVPLLNSLPSEILKNTNITMGFPIQHSHAYRLAESLIHLHLHSSKISNLSSTISRYHKDDILAVLNNDLIAFLNHHTQIEKKDFSQAFIGEDMLSVIISKVDLNIIGDAFSSCNKQTEKLLEKLLLVFSQLIKLEPKKGKEKISQQELDAIHQISQIFTRLQNLIETNKKPDTLLGFYTLYKQLVQNLSQPFKGDIDKGLQLMGLLETRLMDFENVVILSVNEDILPASAFTSSFIPSDIRYIFELPGIQERTAVFAYHFYRLIQRAKNIYLVYSTTKKKMSGGEKSRFIKQLEFELERDKNYNKNIKIKQQLLNFKNLNIHNNKEILVIKNSDVLKSLDKLATKGLSPTSLITYTKCSLQFYFKYIEKIYEPDSPEDIIDERIMGNVIHKILEDFYSPYTKKKFPYEKLISLKKNLPKIIAATFKNEFNGKIVEGPNYLSLKDTEHYLNKFIDYEIQAAKKETGDLIILGVEQNLQRTMQITLESKTKDILIKGNADRIDEKNNSIRILDYKTGNVEKKNVKIPKNSDEELNEIFTDNKFDKALQLFIYHWLYRAQSKTDAQVGIVSFRHIKSPYIMLKQTIEEDLDRDFYEFIRSIFDPNIPFTQTTEEKNCSY